MENLADIVLWAALGALVLAFAVRAVASLPAVTRFFRSVAQAEHRRRLFLPVGLVALTGVALLAAARAASVAGFAARLESVLFVLFGVGLTWLTAAALAIGVRVVLAKYDVAAADNLTARRVHTQYVVLLRIGLILVWVVGAAVILSTFPEVRALGNGLLASAGIAGLVLGLAAQRTIGNFLAGIQIAFTQPIRLDDAVVIADEWGWIEDITTTYVVVKVWDERRLIVPFAKLLEEPFQNWTRARADIIGSVTLWMDYGVQVAALRQELLRAVQETELWDGRVAVLQVVDCGERAMQLRALVSASTSPRAWDLRCHVRERLITYVAREFPKSLPTVRAEVGSASKVGAEPTAPISLDDPGLEQPDVGGLPGEPARDPNAVVDRAP